MAQEIESRWQDSVIVLLSAFSSYSNSCWHPNRTQAVNFQIRFSWYSFIKNYHRSQQYLYKAIINWKQYIHLLCGKWVKIALFSFKLIFCVFITIEYSVQLKQKNFKKFRLYVKSWRNKDKILSTYFGKFKPHYIITFTQYLLDVCVICLMRVIMEIKTLW